MLYLFRAFFRRHLTIAIAFASILNLVAAQPAFSSDATTFIKDFGNKLTEIINSQEPLKVKREQALPLIQENVDIALIGKFCLGRYWHLATADQQKRYLDLFHQVLFNAVTDRIGDYKGVQVRVVGSSQRPDGELVHAQILRPHEPTADMQALVSRGANMKVIDLIGEGTSMRLTQRQDYVSYLARNGGNIETLIKALERQISRHR